MIKNKTTSIQEKEKRQGKPLKPDLISKSRVP